MQFRLRHVAYFSNMKLLGPKGGSHTDRKLVTRNQQQHKIRGKQYSPWPGPLSRVTRSILRRWQKNSSHLHCRELLAGCLSSLFLHTVYSCCCSSSSFSSHFYPGIFTPAAPGLRTKRECVDVKMSTAKITTAFGPGAALAHVKSALQCRRIPSPEVRSTKFRHRKQHTLLFPLGGEAGGKTNLRHGTDGDGDDHRIGTERLTAASYCPFSKGINSTTFNSIAIRRRRQRR